MRKERGIQGVRLLHNNQRGFTLIELLIGIAITGVIISGIGVAIFQVFDINARSVNRMHALRQVQNAGYWISQDAQMAQNVEPATHPNGFPLILRWTDWDGTNNVVTYSLEPGGEPKQLKRSHSISGVSSETIVARHIIPGVPKTNVEFTNGVLILTVTATVQEQSQTRVYKVAPRPAL